MKLIRLKGTNGRAVYINPLNINRISCYVPYGSTEESCDIEMVGDDSESYHVVANSIEEVVKLIEDWGK